MKKLLLILFIGLTFNAIAKPNKTKTTKINTDSLINVLNIKIDKIEQFQIELNSLSLELSEQNKKLVEQNNKLEEQLLLYTTKEDFYSAAITDQATRFSLIVAALITILGLASFTWFRSEWHKVDKKIRKFKEKFAKVKEDNNYMRKILYATTANSYNTICRFFLEKNNLGIAIHYSILTALYAHRSNKYSTAAQFDVVVVNLNTAINLHKKINNKQDQITVLEKYESKILENLDEISTSTNQEIKNHCAEVRVLFNQLNNMRKQKK